MKIAIEAQRIFRKKKHGMDIVALELIRNLQKIDLNNEYYILVRRDQDQQALTETQNFHIIELPHVPYPIWEQIYLRNAIRKIKPDILHCTSNTAPLKVKVPLVLTLHDIIFMHKSKSFIGTWYQIFGNLYRKWLLPQIIPQCKKIITVSDFEKAKIQQFFFLKSNTVTTVYNAYSPHFKNIVDRSLLKHYKSKYELPGKFILYLGNTDPKKNMHNVIKAFSLFCRRHNAKLPLVIVDIDQSFLNTVLKECDELPLSSSIICFDYVPNDELVYLYNLATLFLYPSLYESFGIPILEAMACGTPVITSRSGAMPEVSDGYAKLVNPEDPNEISEAINELITNNAKNTERIEEAMNHAQLFRWENTARKVLDVYNSI